ncbi:MAG: DUF2797 domain-containing protein, partial [Candidatus Saccharimonadales bacterium]
GFGGADFAPQLTLQPKDDATFVHLQPRDQVLTLTFDTEQRYCTGWHNLETSESLPCPDDAKLPPKYHQCIHCQRKTGFNPAFYHAKTISAQQQARNQLPHSLYLAHFGTEVIKIGITWAERGIKRFLDQGARSGLIVKIYPSADIARQREAQAAKLMGIYETVQVRAKLKLLTAQYSAEQGIMDLNNAREYIKNEIKITPEANTPEYFDSHYLGKNELKISSLKNVSAENAISGRCIGMIGNVLITAQGSSQYMLPLGTLLGYRFTLRYTEEQQTTQAEQISLFRS